METEVQGVTDVSGVPYPDPVLTNGDTHAVFGVDDVLPHRAKSAPMATGVAAFASSDMFKSRGCFSKPKAKRWDHRLSTESSSRLDSSLKGAVKHLQPGVISLGGGLPSSDYFPFESMTIKVPTAPYFSETETEKSGQLLSVGKHDARLQKSHYDLSIALNYGQATGAGQLLRFVTEHTEVVHQPPYSDWSCCLTSGSTSALDIAFRTFCNRGDYILTEEYSFSTALETARPLGLDVVGVKMDEHGMLAQDLDHILSTWDESARHAPKPFLVYTVPTGQNPTGATQPLGRRKEILAVAEKHDLYILEDEPYYFLQMDPYSPSSPATDTTSQTFNPPPIPSFLASLTPSYLSLSTSGNVMRLDSFSKTLAPGLRCGWITAPSHIIERVIRAHETSTQNPSGLSMMALYQLLDQGWGHQGFLQWLMWLRVEYSRRRDVIVRACERFLPASVASWTPPAAGMFHWIKIDITKHPQYRSRPQPLGDGPTTSRTAESSSPLSFARFLELEERVFMAAVRHGVLCSRGSWFRAQKGTDAEMFLRTTFAAASEEQITEAVRRLGEALRTEFLLQEDEEEDGENQSQRLGSSVRVNGSANASLAESEHEHKHGHEREKKKIENGDGVAVVQMNGNGHVKV